MTKKCALTAPRLLTPEQARQTLVARLTPTEREAVLLRYEADLSFREVGQACGIDEATARKRVSRGLDRLRTIFAEEDET